MTDFQKLKNMLDDFGVGYELHDIEPTGTIVRCAEGAKKVRGYSSFFTDFLFDRYGAFLRMGAWEL